MSLNEQPTYYDVLDLKPDASPHEIREAYLRIKSTYRQDSVALYSLIGTSEREDMLRLIEEAYEILSSPEKRKEYDRFHGLLGLEDELAARAPVHPKKIISIDRRPPMETMPNEDELLIAPTTDFGSTGPAQGFSRVADDPFSESPAPAQPPALSAALPSAEPPTENLSPPLQRPSPPPVMINPFMGSPHAPSPPPRAEPRPASKPRQAEFEQSLDREIEAETEWSGLFLRRVREARKISIEELSGITKISKTYLLAIEEENFSKLPAAVFVRGFVTQVARTLRLPINPVVAAYLNRFNLARADKAR